MTRPRRSPLGTAAMTLWLGLGCMEATAAPERAPSEPRTTSTDARTRGSSGATAEESMPSASVGGTAVTADASSTPSPGSEQVADPAPASAATGAGAAAPPASPGEAHAIRVGLFRAAGVSSFAFAKTVELLAAVDGVELAVIDPGDVRRGALRGLDVVIFTGGSGARQGKALGEDGRARVREWVEAGGGYVGICAGSYLAMQGEEEFNKLAILAGRNATGDFWKRGVADLEVVTRPGKRDGEAAARSLQLHFANGPVFARESVAGLPDYVTLAEFVGETYSTRNDTHAGEMPGTPAILATRFGRGRILLFSPNPILGEEAAKHPELLLDAIEWAERDGKVAPGLGFDEVFDGPDPIRRGRHAPSDEHAALAVTEATVE